jgi:hypothetical protein
MAAEKDLLVKAQMSIPLALKAHQESAGGAAKAWTRSSNVHRKAVGRVIPEPSICKIWPTSLLLIHQLTIYSFKVSPSTESYAKANL